MTFHAHATNSLDAYTTNYSWVLRNDDGTGHDYGVCSGSYCGICPVAKSGTLTLTATVNGVVQTATMRIVVQCMFTGPAADSAFLRIINDTLTRTMLHAAWVGAITTGPAGSRREMVTYWSYDSSGQRFTRSQPSLATSTPCSANFPMSALVSLREFVNIHIQPFSHGNLVPCDSMRPWVLSQYDALMYYGPSASDFAVLRNATEYFQEDALLGWGVEGDYDYYTVFRTPSSMTLVPVGNHFRITSDWTPYVRRYPRSGSGSCPVY